MRHFFSFASVTIAAIVTMAGAASADEVAPADPPSVVVWLRARRPVHLEERDEHGSWQRVCDSPCGLSVPASGAYRIVGHEGRTSQPIALTPGVVNEIEVDADRRARLPEVPTSTQHKTYCPNAGDVAESYGSPFVLFPLLFGAATLGVGTALLATDDGPARKPSRPPREEIARRPQAFSPPLPRTLTVLDLAF